MAIEKKKRVGATLVALGMGAATCWVGAQPKVPEIFADADLDLGVEMIQEHQCNACHIRKVGGDGMSIYKPGKRITEAGFLRGMVEQCNTDLGLAMFPEEVTAVAAILNRDHYRFSR